MDKKQCLKSIRYLDAEIKELEQVLVFCEDSRKTLYEINKLKQQRNEELKKIVSAIESIDNSLYRTVLLKRYASGKSVKQIAREMHYAYEYVYEILRKAERYFELN